MKKDYYAQLSDLESKILKMIDEDNMDIATVANLLDRSITTIRMHYDIAKRNQRYLSMPNDPREISFVDYCKINLPYSICTCLHRRGIMSYEDFIALTDDDIKKIRGIGAQSFDTLVKFRETIMASCRLPYMGLYNKFMKTY